MTMKWRSGSGTGFPARVGHGSEDPCHGRSDTREDISPCTQSDAVPVHNAYTRTTLTIGLLPMLFTIPA